MGGGAGPRGGNLGGRNQAPRGRPRRDARRRPPSLRARRALLYAGRCEEARAELAHVLDWSPLHPAALRLLDRLEPKPDFLPHGCEGMTTFVIGEDPLIHSSPRFREYALIYPDEAGGGVQIIRFCPFCGAELPDPLRDEWFRRVQWAMREEEFDLDRLPEPFRSDIWWREPGRRPEETPEQKAFAERPESD